MSEEIECTGCQAGIRMCYNRPCMGTPEEFNKIIDAGFANNLHLDYYVRSNDEGGDIEMLTGSIHQMDDDLLFNMVENIMPGKEKIRDNDPTSYPFRQNHTGGRCAPWWPVGRCSLLTKDNQCTLHSLKLKPEQGRTACCKEGRDGYCKSNKHYSELWNSDFGKKVITRWKELVNL